MMRKFVAVLVLLCLCNLASAGVITFVDNGATLYPTVGSTIKLEVISTVALMGMDVIGSISGGSATVTGAMSISEGVTHYGWEAAYGFEPVIASTSAEFGGGSFNGKAAGLAGYLNILYNGGTVVVNLTPGRAFGGSYYESGNPIADGDIGGQVTFGETVIPEPVTVALLGLGGLFLRRRK